MKRRHRTCLFLLSAVAFAAFVRLWGIGFVLPEIREPDGHIVYQARDLHSKGDKVDWNSFAKYPHLMAWILAPGSPTGRAPIAEDRPVLDSHLEWAALPTKRARILSVLLSLLVLPGTWFLTRRLCGRDAANLATLLVAASLLHLTVSQHARPHGTNTALSLWTVIAAIHLRRGAGPLGYLVAGTVAALAIGSLQFGWFVGFPLLTAHLMRAREERNLGIGRGLILLLPIVATVPVFYTFMFFPPETTATESTHWLGTHAFDSFAWKADRFPLIPRFLMKFDPMLMVLTGIGAVYAIGHTLLKRNRPVPNARASGAPTSGAPTSSDPTSSDPEAGNQGDPLSGVAATDPDRTPFDRRDLIIVLAYVLPYLGAIGGIITSQARFLVPFVPYMACLAAYGVDRLVNAATRSMRSTFGRSVVRVVVFGYVLALPGFIAVKIAWLQSRPDTLTLAANWIQDHLDPEQDKILIQHSLSLPLISKQGNITKKIAGSAFMVPWLRYQRANVNLMDQAPEQWELRPFIEGRGMIQGEPTRAREVAFHLERSDADYIVIRTTPHDGRGSLLETARKHSELVHELPVTTAGSELEIMNGLQDSEMFQRVLHGTTWGPPLEIHRIDRKQKKGWQKRPSSDLSRPRNKDAKQEPPR